MTVSREEWLSLLWRLEGGSGEPSTSDRKRLLRRLRTIGTTRRKPPDVAATTEESQSRMMRWLETVTHSAGRSEVLERLEQVPLSRRFAYMPKPWRGRAGNKARTAKRVATGASRRERACALRSQGLTEAKIAEELGVSTRQVRRYLNGR